MLYQTLTLKKKDAQKFKSDKEIVASLNYEDIDFSVSKKIRRLKQKTITVLMYLDLKISKHIPLIYQKEMLKISRNYC